MSNIEEASVRSSINDFRKLCSDKMLAAGWNCGKNDVIETAPGCGYRINSWITVREGLDKLTKSQIEADCDEILRLFNRRKRLNNKQITGAILFSNLRKKNALSRLTGEKKLRVVCGSGSSTTYELI